VYQPGVSVMFGSAAEHFTKAIDAARLATPPDNAASGSSQAPDPGEKT
jgi:hypothetical protein